ncbi:MAG TPA: TraM recognition domain-containing protein, partial [Coxiellaceae bacterium]|nr:TraM recognition domain-containing protein [Coxiellaceae bacterium]
RVFTSLADTYGHIMRTKLAEVDLKDVVLNRRILVVLLPALEKSPEELSNLGKVIIASLKAMMAAGLGEDVEGNFADLIESKPTNSKTPFLCILDEYGYYAVKGFAVVPAQARSLGFSVIFAGQDLPAFQKASKEEAASIGANTNIKICMKLEDPIDTWDFFMKSAGESYVTHVDSFQVDSGSVIGNYADSKGAKLEKRSRIDLLDLKEQREGEAHILFKSKIVRAKMFYANPKTVKVLRLNHYLKVDMPLDADVIKMVNSFSRFEKTVNANQALFDLDLEGDEIGLITKYIHTQAADDLIDRSSIAMQLHQQLTSPARMSASQSGLTDHPAEEGIPGQLDVFLPMSMNGHLQEVILTDDINSFRKPLLNRYDVRDQVEYLERLCGKNAQQSTNIALEIVSDMQKGTFYPPEIKPTATGEELASVTDQLIEAITLKKEQAANNANNTDVT